MNKCIYCGREFPRFHRHDQNYCEDVSTCRSLAHQQSPRDYRQDVNNTANLVHAPLPHDYCYSCDVCGVDFFVNKNAVRKGKRKPMYCSRACKQKAYRERKKQESAADVTNVSSGKPVVQLNVSNGLLGFDPVVRKNDHSINKTQTVVCAVSAVVSGKPFTVLELTKCINAFISDHSEHLSERDIKRYMNHQQVRGYVDKSAIGSDFIKR